MPWKQCPHCSGLSYSAASRPDAWICPYCGKDIKHSEFVDPDKAKSQTARENLKSPLLL